MSSILVRTGVLFGSARVFGGCSVGCHVRAVCRESCEESVIAIFSCPRHSDS